MVVADCASTVVAKVSNPTTTIEFNRSLMRGLPFKGSYEYEISPEWVVNSTPGLGTCDVPALGLIIPPILFHAPMR